MWSLILPPLIIVVALGFILWYLAVRGTDPKLREVAADIPDAPGLKTRIKAWTVRVTERAVSRSRITFLRMHNKLSGLATRLRERRNQYARVLKDRSAAEEKTEEPGLPDEPMTSSRAAAGDAASPVREAPMPDSTSGHGPNVSEERPRPRLEENPRPAFSVLAPLRRGKPEPMAMMNGEDDARAEDGPARRGFFGRNGGKSAGTDRPAGEQRVGAPIRVTEESLIGRIADNPKDYSAYEALGDYYMESGNVQDAKECYRQVLKLSPAHRGVKMKIRRMEKLLSQKG